MDIFVDFDGTLIGNHIESQLFKYQKDMDLSFDNSSTLWDWYNRFVAENTDQVLNINLIKQLINLKEEYRVNLHLWTNRSYDLEKYTKTTLGVYTKIFDTFNFYDGFKVNSGINHGIILDNDSKYFINGLKGHIIKF